MDDASRRTAPLVGRATEIAALDAEFGRASSGRFRCVLIEGEPGVGKTRLASEFAARRRDRATWLRARGHPLGVTDAFGLWSELLDGHLRGLRPDAVERLCGGLVDDLAGLLRAVAAIRGSWRDDVAPGRLREALAALLTNLSRQRPVLAVLDDIHLADASSWETLGYLAHDLADAPILVVCTARADEMVERSVARHVLFGLEQDGVLARLALRCLDRDGIGALSQRVLGRPSVRPQLVAWLFERSAGNPLFAITLLEALLAEDADLTSPALDAIPRPVADRVAARLEQLDPTACDVLEVLAVIGRPVAFSELRRLDPRCTEVFPALVTSGLIAVQADTGTERLEITHPVVQSAIYDQIGQPRRHALHRRVARMLVSSHRVDEAVPHFAIGADRGDREAVDMLVQALAEGWSRRTFAEAFVVLGSLDGLLPPGDSRWIDVLDAMPYDAEWSSVYNRIPIETSSGTAALRQIDRTLRGGDRGTWDHTRIALVNLYLAELLGWCGGELEEAATRAATAATEFQVAGEHHRSRIATTERAWIQALAGDFAAQETTTRNVLEDAESAGDEDAVVMALGSLAAAAYVRGRFREAEQVLRDSIELARTGRNPPRERYGLAVLGSVFGLEGRLDEGRGLLREADAVPHPSSDPLVANVDLLLSLLAGDVAAALRDGPHLVSQLGPVQRSWSMTFIAMAAADAEQLPLARRYLSQSGELLAGGPMWIMSGHYEWAAGLVALATPDPVQAITHLHGSATSLLGIGAVPYAGWVLADLADAALLAGRSDVADAAAQRAAEVADALGRELYRGLSALVASCAALARSDHDTAAEQAAKASVLLAGRGYHALEARCQVLLGRALAATDRREAVKCLKAAGDDFETLGASRRRQQVIAQLADLGKPGRRASDRLRGPEALTDRERQVVALAVEGLTARKMGDRLYISERTVETHLARAYAKLGVHSRFELARAVDALDVDDAAP